MPRFEVMAPDGRKFEVNAPDGATQSDAIAYIQRQLADTKNSVTAAEPPIDPMQGVGTGQRILEGVGQGMSNLYLGAKQRLGLASQDEVDEAKRVDAPLLKTGAGAVGSALGSVVGAAPTLIIPGANTVGGAAAVGGIIGALQPTREDESVIRNVAEGAALGGVGQYGLGKLAKIAGDKLATREAAGALRKSQNVVRDATLQASQDAGYVVPPSMAGGSLPKRVMEGVSGKIKTAQAAAVKNQTTTEKLARKALGLTEDAPLTAETMQEIRNVAFQRGYEPVAKAGAIETDRVFQSALDNIVKDYQGASRSFPGAVRNDVLERVNSLRTGVMDIGDALSMTRILREEAGKAYASGDKGLGKATRKASDTIEDQIERALQAAGKNGAAMLKEFRGARQLMAKSHSVEQALVEGGGTVNAKVLGRALQKGKPLSGELRTIGAFANNFGDVAGMPKSGWSNPITALDAFGAAGMAGLGAGPMSIALPAARLGARQAIMSGRVTPQYGAGLLGRLPAKTLEELERLGAGGLLGAYSE